MAEAEAAIDRLVAAPAKEGLMIREIWPLRLRTLLARAHGDEARYLNYGIKIDRPRKPLVSKGTLTGPSPSPQRRVRTLAKLRSIDSTLTSFLAQWI